MQAMAGTNQGSTPVFPSGDGKEVIALACHGSRRDNCRCGSSIINERIVIGTTGVGCSPWCLWWCWCWWPGCSGFAAACLAGSTRPLAALIVPSSKLSGIFLLGFLPVLASLRSCWYRASLILGVFCSASSCNQRWSSALFCSSSVCVLLSSSSIVDARARDLVGVFAGRDELTQALRVDQEAPRWGWCHFLILVQIAHGGACLGLLLRKLSLDFLDAFASKWSQSAFYGVMSLVQARRCKALVAASIFCWAAKLVLRCLRGGIRRNETSAWPSAQRRARLGVMTSRPSTQPGAAADDSNTASSPLQSIMGYGFRTVIPTAFPTSTNL